MSRSDSDSAFWSLLKLVFHLAWLTFLTTRGACVEPTEAKDTLALHGYTQAEVGSRAFLFVGLRGCDSTDAARILFKAVPPGGKEPQWGYVCTGWPFKGGQVRAIRP